MAQIMILLSILKKPFKNVKTILHSWAVQKPAVDWHWPPDLSLPTRVYSDNDWISYGQTGNSICKVEGYWITFLLWQKRTYFQLSSPKGNQL